MSTYDDRKDAKGRSWDQITKNGTGSAASVGVGGTGDSGKLTGDGSRQSAGRTDDLLDDGSAQEDSKGFAASGGKVDTGLEGMNKQGGAQGSRQSAEQGNAGKNEPQKR